jgi:hypothetical protein
LNVNLAGKNKCCFYKSKQIQIKFGSIINFAQGFSLNFFYKIRKATNTKTWPK